MRIARQNDMRGLMTRNIQHVLSGGEMKPGMWTWMRVQFFRLWRARNLRVLLAQHARVPHLVEENGQHLDRKGLQHALISLESTVGNFGIWVQITLAILIFRALHRRLLLPESHGAGNSAFFDAVLTRFNFLAIVMAYPDTNQVLIS
jgi:hypothetical protein